MSVIVFSRTDAQSGVVEVSFLLVQELTVMKRIGYPPTMLATCTAVLILLVSERTSARDNLNFAGKYVEEKAAFNDISTLEVVQSNQSVDITKVTLGKRTVGHCPLDGSEGDYTPDGESGKCKATLKPKYLILECVVLPPHKHDPARRWHTKEKWRLSSDGKILTIDYDVEPLDLPPDMRWKLQGHISGTHKYKRTDP